MHLQLTDLMRVRQVVQGHQLENVKIKPKSGGLLSNEMFLLVYKE